MKNNWIQYLSFVLCAVMLIIIIVQGKKLDEYKIQVNNQIQSLKISVNDDIQSMRYYVDNQLENADKLVSSYKLEPSGIDKDSHCLKAEVSVSLKEWYEDTEVELIATVGKQSINIDMNSDGAGNYSGQISLPVEGSNVVLLCTQIFGEGLTKKEELGGWSDISMLLPLQSSGGGWSGPEYRDGVMSSQFSISIRGFAGEMLKVYEDQDGPDSVQNPEFHIYKNGELEQTLRATAGFPEDNIRIAAGLEPDLHAESSEITYSVGDEWSIECETGDVIDIHFVCQDEYGLGYDFFFQSWKAENESPDNYSAGGAVSGYGSGEALRLFWQ